MTITITHHGTTYYTTFPDDEVMLGPIVRAFVNLMISAGYHRNGIAELFKEGDPNGWGSAWPVPGEAAKD